MTVTPYGKDYGDTSGLSNKLNVEATAPTSKAMGKKGSDFTGKPYSALPDMAQPTPYGKNEAK